MSAMETNPTTTTTQSLVGTTVRFRDPFSADRFIKGRVLIENDNGMLIIEHQVSSTFSIKCVAHRDQTIRSVR